MKLSMADLIPKHCRTTTTGLETAAWAAKILFLLIGVASTAILTARFAFPYLLSLVSFSLPKVRNSVFSWLAPPYLFFTVHLIIMVIWKLHGNQRPEDAVADDNSSIGGSSPLPADLSTKPVIDEAHTETMSTFHVTPDEPDISIENPPESEPSLSDIHTINTSDTTVDNDRSTEQRPWPPPPPPEEMKEDMDYSLSSALDSIDATWKAIMDGKSSPVGNQLMKSDTWEKASHAQAKQPAAPATLTRAVAVDAGEFKKSDTFREATTTTTVDEGIAVRKRLMMKSKTFRESTAAAPATMGWRGRDVLVVGRDELFRKVEAFIKMNYEQMRLQRQESEQRFVEMANAAY